MVLYEKIVGEKFVKADMSDVLVRVEKNITDFLHTNSDY